MNDTERDKLIERIANLADQFACGAAGEPVVYALEGPLDFAEEVVDLVTAARDEEIQRGMADVDVGFAFWQMMERLSTTKLIRCTHCKREGTAKAGKLPDGWEQREVIDPITGTDLVRKWEATLCPDCAKKERANDH